MSEFRELHTQAVLSAENTKGVDKSASVQRSQEENICAWEDVPGAWRTELCVPPISMSSLRGASPGIRPLCLPPWVAGDVLPTAAESCCCLMETKWLTRLLKFLPNTRIEDLTSNVM